MAKILHVGCGRTKIAGAVNMDIDPRVDPAVLGDITENLSDLNHRAGHGLFEPGTYDTIIANHVLEHIRDLPKAMLNMRDLLKEGGKLEIGVPYDLSYGAWQDPTHVRAFNEMSWIYYDEWCWYFNWTDWRLETESLALISSPYGDELLAKAREAKQPDPDIAKIPRAVDEMRVTLVKKPLETKAPESRIIVPEKIPLVVN